MRETIRAPGRRDDELFFWADVVRSMQETQPIDSESVINEIAKYEKIFGNSLRINGIVPMDAPTGPLNLCEVPDIMVTRSQMTKSLAIPLRIFWRICDELSLNFDINSSLNSIQMVADQRIAFVVVRSECPRAAFGLAVCRRNAQPGIQRAVCTEGRRFWMVDFSSGVIRMDSSAGLIVSDGFIDRSSLKIVMRKILNFVSSQC
jgi:hypothetical protein